MDTMNYQIGPWLFVPERCVIISDDIETELEPILFKLLSYFVISQDRIVPRQELVEKVWQQKFVDDNAINRAISELRKKLSHVNNATPMIKTHYRKGYSLVVPVIEQTIANNPTVDASSEGSQSPISNSSNVSTDSNQNDTLSEPAKKHRWILIIVIILLVINVNFYLYNRDTTRSIEPNTEQQSSSNIEQIKTSQQATSADEQAESEEKSSSKPNKLAIEKLPHTIQGVTWNTGQEMRPIISTDRLYYAYNNRREPNVKSFVKRNSDLKEVELVYKDLNVVALSWQKGSHHILAEVSNYKDECFYGLFDLSNFSDNPPVTNIKSCDKEIYGGAELSADGKKLFFVELDKNKQGGEIAIYDLQTKRTSILVPSGDAQYGVVSLKLSPDNNQLLYQWHERDKPLSIHLLDLKTREIKKLYQMPVADFPMAYHWMPNGDNVGVQIGTRFVVMDLTGKLITNRQIDIKYWVIGLAVEDQSNMLIAQAVGENLELTELSNLFATESSLQVESLVKSDSMDYYMARSKKNPDRSYFNSSRTGRVQVWKKEKDHLQQLSSYPDNDVKKMGYLQLSPNEKFIVYIRGDSLDLLNIETKETSTLALDLLGAIGSYQWHAQDNVIYFDMETDGIRQVWSYDLDKQEQRRVTKLGGHMLVSDPQGELFYLNEGYLLGLHSEFKQKLTIPIGRCWCSVSITNNALYSLDGSTSFYKMPLNIGENSMMVLPFRTSGVRMLNDNMAIAARINNAPSQIKRVTWEQPIPLKASNK